MAYLIRFALTQRLLILLWTGLLIGSGYYAFKQIPIDAFPEVSPTQVKVIVKLSGMTPEEIESQITAPIEVELLGIPKQTRLRSLAKYAITDITLDFEEGTDIYWARQQVAERLNSIWSNLPTGVTGGIAPMTTPLGEIYMFAIEGGDLDLMQRRELLDWVIRPILRTVKGVAEVNALGGLVKSFVINPDNSRMLSRKITMAQLISVLESNNRNDGAGRLDEGEETLIVRVEGRIKTLEDIKAIVIQYRENLPITIGDVAEVKLAGLTRYGAVSKDGKGEAVTGLVLSLRGANAQQVVTDIEIKLAEISRSLPKGVTLETFYNRGHLVKQAVNSIANAMMMAIVWVVIILIVFLGNLRAALTVALSLPLAAFITFILMKTMDMSLNLMSLGGLAIAIGMLVDGSVVVVENIMNHLSDHGKQQYLPRLHLIYRATREVAIPVISGTLIIIIVFLPLITLQGLEGKLFTPVALTIVFALSASVLLSLTVIPVLASYLLTHISNKTPWFSRKIQALYQPLLIVCLAHSKKVLGITLILLLISIELFTQIGRTFMPTMDEGDIVLQLEKLPSISLTESVALDGQVQKSLLKHIPEIKNIIARVGTDELGLDPMSLNDTDTFLVLKPKQEWRVEMKTKTDIIDAIREIMLDIPGIAVGFSQPIELRVSEMLTGASGDVVIKILGADLEILNQKADEMVHLLKQIEGATDVLSSENEGMQFLQLNLDQQAIGRWGLNSESLEKTLRAQIEGISVGIVQEGIKRTPLIIRGNRNSANFSDLRITLPAGGHIPITAVATLERVEGVVAIEREQGQRFVVISTNVEGRDLVGFVNQARKIVAEQLALPTGYTVEFGGEFENQQRASARLITVIPIALILIFLLLFATFSSVRQAVLVLANIPFAMIGGVFALWYSAQYLSVPASVGFIALLGIAVLNGVMMVSYFNQLRATGMALTDVVLQGSLRRLRPVLMTASLTAFGLLPLLYATGPGSEIQKPLAIVVIGGLISSTFLTLVLLPILYQLFIDKVEKV
jgi:cobalt-zinc-cadmium resistance protein CzcA